MFAEGQISATDLRAIEDRLIADVVKKQKEHGLHFITDGEFRRSYWHLDFMWGFATKYVPLERLLLSPQCGFASCEIGNKLTEEEQWAKLDLICEITEEIWG